MTCRPICLTMILLVLAMGVGPCVRSVHGEEEPAAAEMTEAERSAALERAKALDKKVVNFHGEGKYAEAIPLARMALGLREKALGPVHSLVASSLAHLALLLEALGSYEEARPLLERALKINEKALGPMHPEVATSLNNLGSVLEYLGRPQEARPLYERALKICEEALGPAHPDVAASVGNLALLLASLGSYEEARPLFERALKIDEEALGPAHPSVATSLNNLALLLMFQGSYEEARPLFERALKINEGALGPAHPSVATSLNNLASVLESLGRYEEARPLYERAVLIYEKALGRAHPDVATSQNNLGLLLMSLGSYEEARPLFERALKIREEVLGPAHPEVATSLSNLGLLLVSLGSYAEARPLYERALTIDEKSLGPAHPLVATPLNNLASLLKSLGSYEEAVPLLERALKIDEESLGPSHPSVAMSLGNLASLLKSLGRYEEARPLLERALQIMEEALGPAHPSVATSLNNLGALLYFLGSYEEARPLYERALKIDEGAFGTTHPSVAMGLSNLGHVLKAVGQDVQAADRFERALRITGMSVRRNLTVLEGSDRVLLTGTLRSHLDDWLSIASHVHRSAYPEVLRYKGLVARAEAAERRLARRGSEAVQAMVIEQRAAERRLARLANSMPARFPKSTWEKRVRTWQAAYAKASEERERLALSLQRKFEPLRHGLERLGLTLADIQGRLGPDEVLIDTLRSGGRYLAWIIRPQGDPARVELGGAEGLEEAAAAFAACLEDAETEQAQREALGAVLRDMLWIPLEKRLGKGTKRVRLCPDAALATVPLAALPSSGASSGKGRLLADDYLFSSVSAAQDLIPWKEEVRVGTGALLLGDVEYDRAVSGGTKSDASRAAPSRPARYVARRPTQRAPRGGTYKRLPGTAAEIEALGQKIGASAVLLSKDKATEDAVRAGVGGKRIVHLATHGFVRDDLMKGLRKGDERTKGAGYGMRAGLERQLAGGHDPMNLSGLALAGANPRSGGGEDDGILTALAASHLNLDGVELVVLSACETALGTAAAGEGVLGLIRGFQMAGASRVIGSLWKVDDEATKALMVKFHDLWRPQDGQKPPSAAEALRQAQDHVRGQEKWAHPYYWAAWVLWGLP